MRKRFIILALLAAICCPALLTPSFALATGNVSNTEYEFLFNCYGCYDNTTPRQKWDSTPSYLRVTTTTLPTMYFYVDGANYWNGSWSNQTMLGRMVVYGTGHYSVHNYVYENGYSWARLRAESTELGLNSIWGCWSPDSTYVYN